MRISRFRRGAFGAGLVSALLAGCAGAPSAISPPKSAGDGQAKVFAKTPQLLYVSTARKGVDIYRYDSDQLVGRIGFHGKPLTGICSDNQGHVWVPTSNDNGAIVEYAHGGSTPIRTLSAPSNYGLLGCSVDAGTGDLAVTGSCDYGSGRCLSSGSIFIYHHAQGRPVIYQDPNLPAPTSCAYDNEGDLFVDGETGTADRDFGLAELRSGSKKFTKLSLNKELNDFGGVQTIGPNLAVANGASIDEFSVNGNNGVEVAQIPIYDANGVYSFWVYEKSLIVASFGNNQVQYYKFPAGGNPNRRIFVDGPKGVTVSVAPSASVTR
ncbi:MAG TPA: hypothetical protein VFE16_05225 [Candidatus Cybelea sp.]|jgi:hypothetical protein|nr:hypothetical protein [Candidatus Cybelea sp.]